MTSTADIMSGSVRRLAVEALPHLHLLVAGTACMLASTIAELAITQTGGELLDLLGSTATLPKISAKGGAEKGAAIDAAMDTLFWRLGCLFAVIAIIKHAGEYFLKLAGERLTARVRKALFEALLRQRIAFFDDSPTGELVSVLWSDVESIHMAVAHHLPDLARFSIGCVCSAIGMAFVSVRLTAYAATVAPLIGIFASIAGAYVARLGREYQQQVAAATSLATEGLASVQCVQAFGQEQWVAARFGIEADECARRALLEMRVHKCWNASNLLQMTCAALFVLRLASRALLEGELSAGGIASLGLLGVATGNAANDAANAWARARSSAAKAARALSMLDDVAATAAVAARPSVAASAALAVAAVEAGIAAESEAVAAEDAEEDGEGARSGGGCFSMRLREVRFTYPSHIRGGVVGGGRSAGALDGVSLRAAAGRTTALVGPSGCGKSTILNLLLRFYQPDSGVIELAGVDASRLPTQWLREHVAVVPQECTLVAPPPHLEKRSAAAAPAAAAPAAAPAASPSAATLAVLWLRSLHTTRL